MTSPHIHVIGAGLAGLSAAIALRQAGCAVTVLEAGPAAGGRCRSYFDRELGLRVDNGNHMLLSGNYAAFEYLDTIGARSTMTMRDAALFPFIDLATGQRWNVKPNAGRLPWWILSRGRRVPGTHLADYLALKKLARVQTEATVAASLTDNLLYRRLIQPLAIAALNTPPEIALARLLGSVMQQTLLLGGAACIPAVPHVGLSESLIDPAVTWLREREVEVICGRRVASLQIEADRVAALESADGAEPAECVVLAVPPWVASDLLPGVMAPTDFQAIVNIHFRVDADPGPTGFIGLLGGTAEWVFVKPGHVSVTISAANRLAELSADAIAAAVWPDVRTALNLRDPMPAWRVVKERRATFAATAEQEKLRPGARTRLGNLVLAGDWTDTGLPATIEGAIRSGRTAADTLLAA